MKKDGRSKKYQMYRWKDCLMVPELQQFRMMESHDT